MPGDDYQLLMTTASGKMSHGATWSSRFWPLGLSDYSILLLFGQYGCTAVAHYIWNSLILIFSSVLMFNFIKQTTNNSLFALIALMLLFSSAGFTQIHMECIYSERMIFCSLCIFIYACNKTKKTENYFLYVPAFVFATYTTYMKELVFVIFLIVAVTNLLFNKNLSKQSKIFYQLLIANSLVFLAIYVYRRIFRPSPDGVFATIISDFNEISFMQFQNEPILFLISAMVIFRAYNILFRHDRSNIFIDSLLFASMGYAFCYFLLKLYSGYYLFPSVVLFLPAFSMFFSKIRLGILVVLLSFNSNFAYNKWLLINNFEHRKTDHIVFENIVKRFNEGWNIYWLSDATELGKDAQYRYYDRMFCMNRFQHFLNYYSRTKFPITLIFNTEKIKRKSMVIVISQTLERKSFANIKTEFQKLSPKKVAELNGNIVYEIE